MNILAVAGGGALGALLRYAMTQIKYPFMMGVFPIHTVCINLLGCLIIGFLWGVCHRVELLPTVKMFLFIGILGGFTTFSTFALENYNLLRDGDHLMLILNILISNIGGIALVYAGYGISRISFVA